MNHRMLSESEKKENARGRNARKNERQCQNRRDLHLEKLAALAGGPISLGIIATPSEAFALAFAHVNAGRAIGRRLIRRAAGMQAPGAPAKQRPKIPVVKSPKRTLLPSHCGVVDPNLLQDQPPVDEDDQYTVLQISTIICNEAKEGVCPYILLDHLAALSKFSYEGCAALLESQGKVSTPFSPAMIDAVRQTRSFWTQYNEGRLIYNAAILLEDLPPLDGDFAYFPSVKLTSLLPGLQVPKALIRPEYLGNIVQEESGWITSIT